MDEVTSAVVGMGRPCNYFEVRRIEAWNSKNCELNHHLHNPNCPNQRGAPWLLEPWGSYTVVMLSMNNKNDFSYFILQAANAILSRKMTPYWATTLQERGAALGVPTSNLLVSPEGRKESTSLSEKQICGGSTTCLFSGNSSRHSTLADLQRTSDLRATSPRMENYR